MLWPLRVGAEQASGYALDRLRWRLLPPGHDHRVEVLPAVEPTDRPEMGDADIRVGQLRTQQVGHGLVRADQYAAAPGGLVAGKGDDLGPACG